MNCLYAFKTWIRIFRNTLLSFPKRKPTDNLPIHDNRYVQNLSGSIHACGNVTWFTRSSLFEMHRISSEEGMDFSHMNGGES